MTSCISNILMHTCVWIVEIMIAIPYRHWSMQILDSSVDIIFNQLSIHHNWFTSVYFKLIVFYYDFIYCLEKTITGSRCASFIVFQRVVTKPYRVFWFGLVWFVFSHINHCWLCNAKSCFYIYIKYIIYKHILYIHTVKWSTVLFLIIKSSMNHLFILSLNVQHFFWTHW